MSLADDPDPVDHDQTLTYTSVVRNDGTSGTGPGAIVRVVLPVRRPGREHGRRGHQRFTCGANTTVDPTGTTFDCIGDFGGSGTPTDSTTITATMIVDSDAPPPATLSVTVTADPGPPVGGAIAESNETNNEKTEETSISGTVCGGQPCVDLFAQLIVDTPIVAPNGGLAFYSATVTNVGNDAVSDDPTTWSIRFSLIGNGAITQVVPAASGITCTAPGGLFVKCSSSAGTPDGMDLAPNAQVMFNVTVTNLNPPGGAALQLSVTADSDNDVLELNEDNNTALAVTASVP